MGAIAIGGCAGARAGVLFALGCLIASPARAEDAGEERTRWANDGELVVTATRREQPILDVPISVTALDAGTLDRMGSEALEDLARATPNFMVAPTGVLGVGQPAIRGIYSPAGAATVGIYIDDVPIQIRSLGFSGSADLRLFDLERVEVLRGPQGTLFGANSMGGTVRYITRPPDLERSLAYATVETAATRGGGPSIEAQGALGAVLERGRLGIRLGGYFRRDGGYIDRLDRNSGAMQSRNVDDVEALAMRFAARAVVGEGFEIRPSILVQRTSRDDLPFFESSRGLHREAFVNRQPGRDAFVLPSLSAELDLGAATLTSVTALLDRRDRQVTDYSTIFGELVLGGSIPGLAPEGGTRSLTDVRQKSVTQEVRLASSTGARLHWTAGVFYRRGRVHLTQSVIEPGIAGLSEIYLGAPVEAVFGTPLLPGGVSYRGFEDVVAKQLAVFGEASLPLGGQIEAVVGARLSRSRLRLRVLSEGPYAGGRAADAGIGVQRETPFTPKLGVNFRPAPNALFYMSVSKGFREGGANAPVPAGPCAADLAALGRTRAPASFQSDRLWSYELGGKASLAGGRFSMSAAAFQIDWKGIQQPVTLSNCGFSYVDNLGAARSRGFELELEARPAARLLLIGALGFVDARFRQTIDGGGTAATPTVIVSAGDRVPATPRWSLRLAAERSAPLGPGLSGYARAEFHYKSSYRRTPGRDDVGYNPLIYRGDELADALIRFGIAAERWRLAVFVENLFDDRSILFNSADLTPATGSSLRQRTLRPRTIGTTLTVRL